MGLLMLSTALDYAYGFWVASPNRKKAKLFLWLSIINNLGILGVFKYYNFFALQFQKGFELLGFHTNPVLLNVALPIGISFYTFHGMSYVFDIYRGNQKPVSNFVEYAVFVSFFPLLVAGPIERANHLLPQVQNVRKFKYSISVDGIKLIIWGLFKKVVLADSIAESINTVYANYQMENGYSLFWISIGFSFQIYCDFSGYSDIASGTARLFGFELLQNFKFPYLSRDIAEFWRRWHVSLSSWFRDYLYIPLGGSRRGKIITIRNTLVIFLVSGFWHGASWNFIFWGLIHAVFFIILILFNKTNTFRDSIIAKNKNFPSLKEVFQVALTFLIVNFSWIYFRVANISEANVVVSKIFRDTVFNPSNLLHKPQFTSIKDIVFYEILAVGLLIFIFDWINRKNIGSFRINNIFILIVLIFTVIWNMSRELNNVDFIYFQF